MPFHLQIGLAIGDERGVCRKILDTPVLDRNDADPHVTVSPCVLIENDVWRMWYVSGLGWKPAMPKPDNGGRYMLYNGNGYGRTGIGLAVLDRGILGHGTADPSVARLWRALGG